MVAGFDSRVRYLIKLYGVATDALRVKLLVDSLLERLLNEIDKVINVEVALLVLAVTTNEQNVMN